MDVPVTMLANALLLLVLSTPAGQSQSAPAASMTAGPSTLDRNLDDQVVLITGNNTPEARRIGARGLLAIGSTESVRRLGELLGRDGDPAAQVAICLELAAWESPPTELIEPVLHLLGSARRDVSEAAGQAISQFSRNEVVPRLARAAAGPLKPGNGSRAIIAALGRLGAVPASIDALLSVPCQNDGDLQIAVLAALERATGTTFVDLEEARRWWTANRSRDLVSWLTDRDARRDHVVQGLETRVDELTRRLTDMLRADYLQKSDADKTAALLGLLSDPEPGIRSLGLDLTNALITDRKAVPAAVVTRVRAMLADSVAELRRVAALVLADIRDPADAAPLREALSREASPRVRGALLKALGRLGDAAALPVLLEAMNDPAREVVAEAASAVGMLCERVGPGLPACRAAADRLVERLDAGATSDPTLTEAILDALSRWADKRFAPVFSRYLTANWSVGIRQAAIRGASVLNDAGLADLIAGMLSDDLVPIRLAAASAMGVCGHTDAHLAALLSRVESAAETEMSVRAKVWESFGRVLAGRSVADQCRWAERLAPPVDHDSATRRAEVLTRIARELTDEPAAAGQRARVAEALCDAYVALGQADAAVGALDKALAYAAGRDDRLLNKAVGLAIDHRRVDLLVAALRSWPADPPASQASSGRGEPLNPAKIEPAVRLLAAALSAPPTASSPAVDEARLIACIHRLAPEWGGLPAHGDAAARRAAIDDLIRRVGPSPSTASAPATQPG